MLKRLHLRNFTVFEDADFEFGPGLNVVVGTNGTGKTHVLKVGYSMLHALLGRIHAIEKSSFTQPISLHTLEPINSNLQNIFQPVPFHVSELIRRNTLIDEASIDMTMAYAVKEVTTSFMFYRSPQFMKSSGGSWSNEIDNLFTFANPVFIPAKEVLTSGWLPSLYERFNIPIDQTYPDLLRLLMGPPLRQPEPASILAKLQQLIGGKVEEEGGHFYLSAANQPRMEMNLVAEGMRKFATLYKLLNNGTLTPETTLFWDEPEANLNPALLREMAAVLAALARAGFQIILATHSLFLLKELHILSRQEPLPLRYFGLSAQPGGAMTVATADNLELLPDIVALDAELEQADRFQRVLDQEDADGN